VWPIIPATPPPHFQQDLRELRRLAAAGLAAHDDDLVLLDGGADLVAPAADWEFLGIADGGTFLQAALPRGDGGLHLAAQPFDSRTAPPGA
jgi:hypothetical protein